MGLAWEVKPERVMQRTGVVVVKLSLNGWWKKDGWMRLPNGLRVKMRVDGDVWMAKSFAIVLFLVMGLLFVAKMLITVPWLVVSLTESVWVARKEDQFGTMLERIV